MLFAIDNDEKVTDVTMWQGDMKDAVCEVLSYDSSDTFIDVVLVSY